MPHHTELRRTILSHAAPLAAYFSNGAAWLSNGAAWLSYGAAWLSYGVPWLSLWRVGLL